MYKNVARALAVLLALTGVAQSANITWVSFHDTDGPSSAAAGAGMTEAADIGYTNLLAANGHSVSRFMTHEPLTADDIATLNASDVVIISRSVSSWALRAFGRLEHTSHGSCHRDVGLHSSQQPP